MELDHGSVERTKALDILDQVEKLSTDIEELELRLRILRAERIALRCSAYRLLDVADEKTRSLTSKIRGLGDAVCAAKAALAAA